MGDALRYQSTKRDKHRVLISMILAPEASGSENLTKSILRRGKLVPNRNLRREENFLKQGTVEKKLTEVMMREPIKGF